MERFDFASLTSVIRADLLDGSFENQQDFVEQMFSPYLNEMERWICFPELGSYPTVKRASQ